METPAQTWRDALPCGNGSLGALVYGRVAGERILLNHEALWSNGRIPPVPETSGSLPDLRALLEAGRFAEAADFFPSLWRKAGFSAEPAHFLPGPDVRILHQPEHPFESYTSQLDMRTGEVVVRWKENGYGLERRVFVSRIHHVLVVRCTTEDPQGLDNHFSLSIHDPGDSQKYLGFGGIDAPAAEVRVHPQGVTLGAEFEDGTGYDADLLVCDAPAEPVAEGIRVRGVRAVTVLVRLTPRSNGLLSSRPEWPSAPNYDRLLAAHAAEHGALMERVSFSLGGTDGISGERMLLEAFSGVENPALMEKMFAYGRYLLVCSSTGAAVYPAHLQGLWNGDYRPAWTGGYFLNENIQMNYWAALPGGLGEALEPVFRLLESHMEDFRDNARRLFGCPGILLPLYMSPRSGRQVDPQPHVIYWTAGAGWMAQHFYEYYLYTGDEHFLRERALPFLREAALFYEAFFVTGPDGYWVSSPSVSPENCPLGGHAGAGRIAVSVNAAMDFAVAEELFANLIEGAERLGIFQDEVPRWRKFLAKIPPYRINEDGAIAEWLDSRLKDNYRHRHLSHLYGIFPGRGICRKQHPDLFQACRSAVERRLVIGIRDQTGWSLAHMAAIWARLGEGGQALECLRLLTRSCLGKNLFTYHNSDLDMGITQPLIADTPAPFQIDANFGFTAAVFEMLVFSRPGRIHVLPALPAAWPEGRIKGVCCHGGVRVDVQWSRKLGQVAVDISAASAIEIEVVFANESGGEMVKLRAGQSLSIVRPWPAESKLHDDKILIEQLSARRQEITV